MDTQPNPFESGTVSRQQNLAKVPGSFFPQVATVFIGIAAAVLVASAFYNVSLWQDGGRPARNVSMNILFVQLFSFLLLLLLSFVQLIAGFILLSKQNGKQAVIAFAGLAIAVFAIVFTMFYDRGSLFFQ